MIRARHTPARRTRARRSTVPLLLLCSVLALAACGADNAGNQPADPASPSASGPASASDAASASGSPSAAGTPGPTASPSQPAPASAAATSLTVDFMADGQNTTDTWTLQCDGAAPLPGSNVPDPATACAALAEQGVALFAEADRNAMCTQNIVGMQRAHVTGTVNGEAVDTSFALTDGCQISRWERLTGLLGPAEGTL